MVEVDGETHDDPAADEQRDRFLRSKGMQVLRFYNTDVLENLDGVVTVILEAVMRRGMGPIQEPDGGFCPLPITLPQPLPSGRGAKTGQAAASSG